MLQPAQIIALTSPKERLRARGKSALGEFLMKDIASKPLGRKMTTTSIKLAQ